MTAAHVSRLDTLSKKSGKGSSFTYRQNRYLATVIISTLHLVRCNDDRIIVFAQWWCRSIPTWVEIFVYAKTWSVHCTAVLRQNTVSYWLCALNYFQNLWPTWSFVLFLSTKLWSLQWFFSGERCGNHSKNVSTTEKFNCTLYMINALGRRSPVCCPWPFQPVSVLVGSRIFTATEFRTFSMSNSIKVVERKEMTFLVRLSLSPN